MEQHDILISSPSSNGEQEMRRVPSVSSQKNSTLPKKLIQAAPFTETFTSPSNAVARNAYLKILITGSFSIVLVIFAILSIYWGALWKTPVRNLEGWVVDFDNGLIGTMVTQGLTSPSPQSKLSKVTWTSIPASRFPGGLIQIADEVVEQKTWVIVAVHANATFRLLTSYASPDASYNGSRAITVYAAEARNENAYRTMIRPSVEAELTAIGKQFALEAASRLVNSTGVNGSSSNLMSVLATSPQTVLAPISYTLDNIVPFDMPVASAVTFVGLIYQLILAFFIVVTSYSAREVTGLSKRLTLRSLIAVRFASAFGAYFFVSLFYSLLSLAFQLEFSRKFGQGGFVLFWMLNWVGMLSVGLALESVITLLTPAFIPFFLIVWIIVNVSVCIFPLEVLPIIYRYGYAVPFYNVSHAVRCIVFGTKNTVGLNFAVLIVWAVISCLTLPLIQWFVRRRDIRALNSATASDQQVVLEKPINEEIEVPVNNSNLTSATVSRISSREPNLGGI